MQKHILILIFALLVATTDAGAVRPRSSKDIKREKQKTEKQIEQTRKQISQIDAETGRQLDRLESIKAVIELRTDTIGRLQARLDSTNRAIALVNDSIDSLQVRTDKLRATYSKTLRTLRARRQGLNDLSFIFSSESFSQAWRRIRYLRQIAKSSERQGQQLNVAKSRLDAARERLESLKTTQASALARLRRTQADMRTEQVAADNLVKTLRKQGKSLSRELDRRRQQANELQRELDKVIEEEIRAAEERRRREAEEARRREEERQKEIARQREAERQKELERQKAEADKNSKKPAKKADKKAESKPATPAPKPAPAPTTAAQPKAPEAKPKQPAYESEADTDRRLTGSFESNKGRLLFPVAGKYTIVSKFGTYDHPDLEKVKVDNLGIDIEVPAGTTARSVFEGVVSSIFRVDGYHNIVIVRHGEYLSVYAGIDALSVKKGDKVKAGQTLGTIFSNRNDNGRTRLHFEIRHEKQKLNPTEWVK